ncbi:dynein regulatory complex subunit 2 isoform X2 [Cricetulus griseus]|uniref:Dynein regulatory complex subunit 2 n=1 Tax=Cricetulus griseus TaxID=10029 RepID=A0A9J7JDJ1_CRIGR|nr:dynein regulatory complex subunit 2 isoform X2 [Cricetulus griseus]XP_027298171.1 dynein regulatory complex subunit 2 isoform X2 [Cricetulus griseus]
MPKKGKKAKIPLSDEEQLLLFQQRLLAEEEAAKKKERLLTQFLKDKLAKEEHNSALNLNKINTQWRTVLREVKTRELHKDIEILSQTFERVVDCKDSVIKTLEEKHFLRLQLENIVEDLWRRFQDALKNYTDATEDRKIAFETLRMKDEKSSKEIEIQMKKIQKLQEAISSLKGKIVSHSRESEWQNHCVRNDKELVHIQLRKLKAQRTQVRGVSQENLVKLTLESNTTLKELKKVVEKGEQILKLAEICRKFETEEEKVLPFYSSALTPSEQEEVSERQNLTQNPEDLTEELARAMVDYSGMENFWKRYNKVKLEVLSLQHRRTQLLDISGKLRELLKQYLDGISVSDEVLSQLNPLFIVNHRSNLPQLSTPAQPEDRRPPKTYNVIEAAHVVSRTL